jgi:hypothetical protein
MLTPGIVLHKRGFSYSDWSLIVFLSVLSCGVLVNKHFVL